MKSRWFALARILVVSVLAVAAAGITYYGVNATLGGEGSEGTGAEQPPPPPTFTAAPLLAETPPPLPTATSPPPAPPSPTPPGEPEAHPTPPPLGCPECAVKAGEQMPVRVEDIAVGPDGKYFIPDRGDGCRYEETWRGAGIKGLEEVALWASGCEQGWTFVPATGELRATIS